jgi:hypothetical protein
MKFTRWFRIASLIAALAAVSAVAYSQVAISITIAPPPLPVYDQPPCPAPNLIWTPGYWSWGPDGYYWVPGAWVEAPAEGLLWTPGYWGYDNGNYMWNDGYWAPEVGFYGGVDYGYGYPGEGFYGGRWMGNTFAYNVAVVRINTTVIRHTYRNQVNYRNQYGRVSYNGGRGGIQARPTAAQRTVRERRRSGPNSAQQRQAQLARSLRQNYAKVNNGHPEHAAMERPARSASDFNRSVPAHAAQPNNNRPNNNNARPNNARPNNNARPTPVTPNRPEARPNARPQPQPRSNVRPVVPNHEVQPQPRPEQRPQARPESRPEARPQPQREQQPEARPQARPEARPEARPQPHQQARPEARPEHPEHPEHPAHPEHEKKQPQGV